MNIEPKEANEVGLLHLIQQSGGIHSRIRLQKLVCIAMFKFGKKIAPFSFSFKSHFYGPYSEELRNTIDLMVLNGLVSEAAIPSETGSSYFYGITEVGKERLNSANKKLASCLTLIDAVISEFGNASSSSIIQSAKTLSGL